MRRRDLKASEMTPQEVVRVYRAADKQVAHLEDHVERNAARRALLARSGITSLDYLHARLYLRRGGEGT